MKTWIKYEHDLTNNDKFDSNGLSLYTDWDMLKLSIKNANQNPEEDKIVWKGKQYVTINNKKTNEVKRSFEIVEFED